MLKMEMKITLASDRVIKVRQPCLAPEGVADRDLHGAAHRHNAPQPPREAVQQTMAEVPLPSPISLIASRTVMRTRAGWATGGQQRRADGDHRLHDDHLRSGAPPLHIEIE